LVWKLWWLKRSKIVALKLIETINPWVGKLPWRRERLLAPVFWPGEFHGLYSISIAAIQIMTGNIQLFRKSVTFVAHILKYFKSFHIKNSQSAIQTHAIQNHDSNSYSRFFK